MADFLTRAWAFLARVRIRLTAAAVAALAALPYVLDQLGVVDWRPILSRFLGDSWTSIVIALIPLALAFTKPLLRLEELDD